jgi:hypothetical protein
LCVFFLTVGIFISLDDKNSINVVGTPNDAIPVSAYGDFFAQFSQFVCVSCTAHCSIKHTLKKRGGFFLLFYAFSVMKLSLVSLKSMFDYNDPSLIQGCNLVRH